MKKAIAASLISLSILLSAPFLAFAQGTGTTAPGGGSGTTAPATTVDAKLVNPIKYDTFNDFVSAVIDTAVQVLMPFVVLGFIWSGFLFIKAQGNPKELEDARKAIWYSIIGAFILFGAWGFSQIIKTTIETITK